MDTAGSMGDGSEGQQDCKLFFGPQVPTAVTFELAMVPSLVFSRCLFRYGI